MLSARLVVDTGMNALGWSRERAIEYLMAHSMVSATEAATETLRYAADILAQALAYKMGSLRMMELRELARQRLGDRFDIREFHEWVLSQGSMPLGVLEGTPPPRRLRSERTRCGRESSAWPCSSPTWPRRSRPGCRSSSDLARVGRL